MDAIFSVVSILFLKGYSMKTDILQLAAKAYQQLNTIEYHIVLGRKSKSHAIEIAFRPDNFYHLAGLHKLKKRYSFQQQTSKWVLSHILNGTLSVDTFSKDQNFLKVKERLHALCILEKVLDSDQTQFYLYDRRKIFFPTKITADYLAKGSVGNEVVIFSFFIRDDNKYCANSIFPESTYDYSQKQMQYTVLLKNKIQRNNGNVECKELYRHTKYDG